MKVGILGSGDVAQSLANGFLKLGHEVMLGSREAKNEKIQSWLAKVGGKAQGGTFQQAAKFGEVVVLATLGTKTVEAMKMAGLENFDDKLVIDTTNPLDFTSGSPKLVGGLNDRVVRRIKKPLRRRRS